jgi:hypothetical protein
MMEAAAMARLSLKERRLARKIARKAWMESNGDAELAELNAKAELAKTGLPPFVIELLAAIIVKLIIEWLNRGEKEPAEMSAELAYTDDETEDEDYV